MASVPVGRGTLWVGDTAPTEHGSFWIDTSVSATDVDLVFISDAAGTQARLKPASLVTAIASEASTRAAADTALSSALATEVSNRAAAVTAEASARVAGDLAVKPLAYSDGTTPGGNTVANTSSPTAFASTYTIPANRLKVGSVIRARLFGTYGTDLIAPTLVGALKFGSSVVLTTSTLTTVAGVVAGAGWSAQADIIVKTIGAGGAVEAQGYAQFATAATTGLSVNMTNTGTVPINTSQGQAVTVNITWGTGSTSNTITLRTMSLEIMDA